MVKRITKDVVAEGNHEALEHVLEHIGVTWPMVERERIFQIVTQAIFPPEQAAHVWEGSNLTHITVEKEPYYPVTVSLRDPPGIWFRNLRLLQIRKKLDLVRSLRVSLDFTSCVIGEVYFKLKALKEIVGKEMMADNYVPKMKKPRMMTTRNRLARDRIENLRRP